MEQTTSVKHSVNLGDLISSMGCCKEYYSVTGKKIRLLQQIDMQGQYYQGAVHPTVDDNGVAVTMNKKMFNMVQPLIESQPYISSFEKYEGQSIDIDFNIIRNKTFVNMPQGAIQNWLSFAFPDLAFDLSKPWIEIDDNSPEHIKEQVNGKVIINFTERYRNTSLDYFFLKNYAPDIIFSGTEKEHWLFCNQWQLDVPLIKTENFLELAYALKESRFMMGNQSMLWNLADAMKTPRVLEVCQFAQNCINGIGENSYGYFHQTAAEYYFRKMYNKTIKKAP